MKESLGQAAIFRCLSSLSYLIGLNCPNYEIFGLLLAGKNSYSCVLVDTFCLEVLSCKQINQCHSRHLAP